MPPENDAQFKADLAHEFIRGMHDVARENAELRNELRATRKEMFMLRDSIDKMTDMLGRLGNAAFGPGSLVSFAGGLSRIAAGLLGPRRKRP